MYKKIIIPFLTIILSLSSVLGQNIKQKFILVLDTESYNACMAQDKDGFLWIATADGLIKYDGYKKKEYSYNELPISCNIIPSLFIDSDDLIWFSTISDGLYCYDKDKEEAISYKRESSNPNSLSDNQFNWVPRTITEDKNGLIWVGTKNGLNSYDKKTKKFTRYTTQNSKLCCNNILTVFVDSKNTIWVGTGEGLCKYDKKSKIFTIYKHDPYNSNSLIDNNIYAVVEDREGNIWIGTKGGLSEYDEKDNKFISHKHDPSNPENSLTNNEIFSLLIDKNDNLWICHPYDILVGIERYNIHEKQFTLYTATLSDKNLSEKPPIQSCFQDKVGTLWLIDNLSKLYQLRLSQEGIKTYSYNPYIKNSLKSNDINVIIEDREQHNLWVGSKGGVNKFDDLTGEFVGSNLSIPDNNITILLEDRKGNFWVGFDDGGLYAFDHNKKLIQKYYNKFLTGFMIGMIQDVSNENIFWLGSEVDGFFKFNRKTGSFKQYKNDPNNLNSLSNNSVSTCIFQDRNGILWLSTMWGLNKFDPVIEKFTRYLHDSQDSNSISGNMVIDSYRDSLGNLWISTTTGGLNKFEEKKGIFRHYGKENGFPTKAIRTILEDNNNLWLSTSNFGIIIFNILKEKVINRYSSSDGLQGDRFSPFATSAIKRHNGELWFSGFNGLNQIKPNVLLEKNKDIPPILLESFSIRGLPLKAIENKPINKIKTIKLPWSKKSFEFEFLALNYINSQKNQYAYKLEGFDKNWNHIETKRFGKYTNIPPGHYKLCLKGANNDGVWNNTGEAIDIIIEPPFWMTWWFRGGVCLILISVAFGIHKWRVRALSKDAEMLEEYNLKLDNEINERKRAEIELAKTATVLHKAELKAERDHAIAETAAMMAHDIRKPFNALKSMLRLLSKLTQEQIRKYSEELDLNIRKVEAMLADIMEASRDVEYSIGYESLLSILDLAIKDVSLRYPQKKINFYYHLDLVPLVNVDDQRMCRAFDNIIANAFDFLPELGGFMWFSITHEGSNAKVVIGNSHSHIPDDKIKDIFQNKFTLGKKSGTGLGLAIVTKIIKGHHGSVSVHNVKRTPNFVPEGLRNLGGVEFIITLSVTDKPSYNLKDPLLNNSEEARAISGMIQKENLLAGSSLIDSLIEKLKALPQKPNLLILDDESIYRIRVRNVIGNLGEVDKLINTYDVYGYKEAIEVLDHIRVDFLICDIDLMDPRNDGFSVLVEAIKKYPDCRVLMHTNRKQPEDIKHAKELGACGFCPKPITEAILVDLLLEKELWLNNIRKERNEQLLQEIVTKYVDAVPGSNILLVNDDNLILDTTEVLVKSAINPKDNVLIYPAKSYMEAVEIIDKKKIDILIADLNLKSTKTGLDICKYQKQKNPISVCIIFSGLFEDKLIEIKNSNHESVDEVFSVPHEIEKILNTAFNILSNNLNTDKNQSNFKNTNQVLKELNLYTMSILFNDIDDITSEIKKTLNMLNNVEKLKNDVEPTLSKMINIKETLDALINYIEKDQYPPKQLKINITKIEQLLNVNKKEILPKYTAFLHFLRHDIVGLIVLVRNYFNAIKNFAKNVPEKLERFTSSDVKRLLAVNEGIKELKNILEDKSEDFNLSSIEPFIKEIIQKYPNQNV